MKLRIKNTQTTIVIIALYQILGGILGIGITAWLMINTGEINGSILLILILALVLYYFSLKTGIILLKKDLKYGVILSIILQFLQVIAIGVGGYEYKFCSGGSSFIGLDFTDGFNFKLDFGITSEFNFSFLLEDKVYYMYINLLAILLLVLLFDILKEIKGNNIEKEIKTKA